MKKFWLASGPKALLERAAKSVLRKRQVRFVRATGSFRASGRFVSGEPSSLPRESHNRKEKVMLFCTELFEGDPRTCIVIGPAEFPCLMIG